MGHKTTRRSNYGPRVHEQDHLLRRIDPNGIPVSNDLEISLFGEGIKHPAVTPIRIEGGQNPATVLKISIETNIHNPGSRSLERR